MKFKGHVDFATLSHVSGWACGLKNEPVSVEILLNGLPIGAALCQADRVDVEKAGGRKQSGFHFSITKFPDASKNNIVRVRISGSDEFLPGPAFVEKIDREKMRREGFDFSSSLFVAAAISYRREGPFTIANGEIKTNGSNPAKIKVLSGGKLIDVQFAELISSAILPVFGIKTFAFLAKFVTGGEPCLQFVFVGQDLKETATVCGIPGQDDFVDFVPPEDSMQRVVGVMSRNAYLATAFTSAALL